MKCSPAGVGSSASALERLAVGGDDCLQFAACCVDEQFCVGSTQGGPDEAVPTARAITGRGRGDNVSVQSTLTRNPANGAGIRPRTRVN